MLEQSVNVGAVNDIFLIGTPFAISQWRNFIHIWRSYICQDRRCCGIHSLPLFGRCHNLVRNYLAGGIMLVEWLSLPMRNHSLSTFLLLITGTPWCHLPNPHPFSWVLTPAVSKSRCTRPDMSCTLWGTLSLIVVVIPIYLLCWLKYPEYGVNHQ